VTAPIHFNWKPPEWSGFDIRHPTSSEPAKRMSNPKARLELMFASVVIEGGRVPIDFNRWMLTTSFSGAAAM
jgi:hypothetical protein